eukprot:TRINITY_DN97798_c0_g1_i1.p2 TRINITY_DN97798_c0_g1~~TRINITY_DN97798_c0_g1_i1.p2  ORF type:complete len:130 (+),score=16.75 TRINITY_DN97798_c0_g1_i1:271-660(+)
MSMQRASLARSDRRRSSFDCLLRLRWERWALLKNSSSVDSRRSSSIMRAELVILRSDLVGMSGHDRNLGLDLDVSVLDSACALDSALSACDQQLLAAIPDLSESGIAAGPSMQGLGKAIVFGKQLSAHC